MPEEEFRSGVERETGEQILHFAGLGRGGEVVDDGERLCSAALKDLEIRYTISGEERARSRTVLDRQI